MPKAILPTRNEEIFGGFFHYTLTDVFYGHDGIENLKHFVPFAQNEWHLFQAGTSHQFFSIFDDVTSRIMARQEALVAAASRLSTIRKRIILPTDFGSFVVDGLRVIADSSVAQPDAYTISLVKSGTVDPGVSAASILVAAGGTPQLFELTPTAIYSPGDFVTLEIKMTSSGAGDFGEIGDIELEYLNKRGNV